MGISVTHADAERVIAELTVREELIQSNRPLVQTMVDHACVPSSTGGQEAGGELQFGLDIVSCNRKLIGWRPVRISLQVRAGAYRFQ